MSPRIRSVHPDICTSEVMASLSAELERTFVRLWTHCDDEGRCVDNPRLIKAGIFPLHDDITPKVLDGQLAKLAQLDLVVRYEVDGRRYLSVRSWDEYQHPQRARRSQYPQLHEDSATSRVLVAEVYGTGVGEGEGEGEGEGVHAPDKPARARDVLFETVAEVAGMDWRHLTATARGPLNRAVGELRTVKATPEEVRVRARRYHAVYPDSALTPMALTKHWPALEVEPPVRSTRRSVGDDTMAAGHRWLNGGTA